MFYNQLTEYEKGKKKQLSNSWQLNNRILILKPFIILHTKPPVRSFRKRCDRIKLPEYSAEACTADRFRNGFLVVTHRSVLTFVSLTCKFSRPTDEKSYCTLFENVDFMSSLLFFPQNVLLCCFWHEDGLISFWFV